MGYDITKLSQDQLVSAWLRIEPALVIFEGGKYYAPCRGIYARLSTGDLDGARKYSETHPDGAEALRLFKLACAMVLSEP